MNRRPTIKTVRQALAAAALGVLAACGAPQAPEPTQATVNELGFADLSLGPADAAVTVIEYASVTCPACRQFHSSVVKPVIEPYARRGEIRYIFRELPTAPVNISVAGAVIARCVGGEAAFDVLADLFENQPGILGAARAGETRAALETLAARHGLSPDAMESCIQDENLRETVNLAAESGRSQGVRNTPTIILNGKILGGSVGRTAESMTSLLDEALGGTAPAPEGEQ